MNERQRKCMFDGQRKGKLTICIQWNTILTDVNVLWDKQRVEQGDDKKKKKII